jgi:hypothetical protein
MKVSGKTALLTLILSVATLLCGSFLKETPVFVENKQEHTVLETNVQRDVANKIDIHFTPLFECDDDYVSTTTQKWGDGLAVKYCSSKLNRVQKQVLEHTPRYLLYCNLKLDIC